MSYEILSATKTLLSDFYHEIDWMNDDGNIVLWEIFYKNYGYALSDIEKDIGVLEMHTPRDLAFFVNAYATGATSKLKSQNSHRWLSMYKEWVSSKCA